ncbi:MAG: hypothetical protein JW939_08595, partial [Candidatus Thermoplasmatota archaeon]|nr:hypothetical protein [Candidatus Thermoplasmatota archaeon]
MIKDGILTTSLNYDHNWVILTNTLNMNKDHRGFFRHRIKRYSRTVVIFHIKRDAKRTLSYLVSKIPWGLSDREAEELLGRDCKRPLREREEKNSIQSRLIKGERIYLNRTKKKADIRMKERRINPMRSKVLQRMKARVKKLFDTHGDNIQSVEDGFRYLGQTVLTRFGIDLGNQSGNKLVEMISERSHRHLRAGVERVFSRLKALKSFERPKARDLSTVIKTVWFCMIGQLVQAKTAVEKGL